jgi:hypothetical protein
MHTNEERRRYADVTYNVLNAEPPGTPRKGVLIQNDLAIFIRKNLAQTFAGRW